MFKLSSVLLQNGTNQTTIWILDTMYEQTEMFHLLWKAVTVPTVECTTAICKTKLIKLPFGCYEQTELCPLLWVDVTGPFIVRFVPDGKFTLPPNTLYFSFIYCHSCSSGMQIYLIS